MSVAAQHHYFTPHRLGYRACGEGSSGGAWGVKTLRPPSYLNPRRESHRGGCNEPRGEEGDGKIDDDDGDDEGEGDSEGDGLRQRW